MSRSYLPPNPGEDADPTGVRALLAALPDPGPMPPEVQQRLLARLARERETVLREEGSSGALPGQSGQWEQPGQAGQPSQPGLDSDDGGLSAELGLASVDVARQARQARRRRQWTSLGAAAAALAVVGAFGMSALRGTAGGTTSVQARGGSEAAPLADSGTSETGIVRIHVGTRNYTRPALVSLAQDLLDGTAAADESASEGTAAASSDLGPIGTTAGLASCLAMLGEEGADQVVADIALFEGAPAVVIVTVDGPRTQVFAVQRGCAQGDPLLLAGPLPMP